MLHTDHPSAEEETPEQLGARLHLISDDMGEHLVMIPLPPGPRAHGRSPPATAIVKRKTKNKRGARSLRRAA